jgi:hypothetical protein
VTVMQNLGPIALASDELMVARSRPSCSIGKSPCAWHRLTRGLATDGVAGQSNPRGPHKRTALD